MESSESGLSASRRDVLRTGALGMGALGGMSMVSASAASAAPAAAVSAMAAPVGSMFLKIEGIPGESLDDKHKDEIEIMSFSWGAVGGESKDPLQDFHLTAEVSKASPRLMLAAAKGTRLRQALLSVRSSGEVPVDFYKVTLEDCLVSSYQTGASQGSVPTDQFSLNYARLTFSYTPQKADGSLGDPIVVTFP